MSPSERLTTLSAWLTTAQAEGPAIFTSSLGAEDMVLTDVIFRDHSGIEVATLDTGRLHPETYDLLARVESHYRRRIRVFTPGSAGVETYVRVNGINGFYDSVSQRINCCAVRKLEPLKRALDGKRIWITGLRHGQSTGRQALVVDGYDTSHNIRKLNPMLAWSTDEVWEYLRQHNVPYNPLHDQGYPSIGCAPCTRAVQPGEDIRAGRWWWEAQGHKECGLHVTSVLG